MRVYISGPLQASTDLGAARSLYEDVARVVTAAGHDPYVPHLHTDPMLAAHISAADVFTRDLDALIAADVVIAHVGAPSTGVGAELGIARSEGIPIVGLRRPNERASRFAEGLIESTGSAVHTFTSAEILRSVLATELAKLDPGPPRSAAEPTRSADRSAATG